MTIPNQAPQILEPNPQRAIPRTIAADDSIRTQINIYEENIVVKSFQNDLVTVRTLSANQIAHALNGEIEVMSDILPDHAVWWSASARKTTVAIWQPPAVWRVALHTQPAEPPKRMSIPMPGLIFACTPSRPPHIFAVTEKPTSMNDMLYHAPTFNTFRNGFTCQGTHHYPADVRQIPNSFFQSYFSMTGHTNDRSKAHPTDLVALWDELDGAAEYPTHDLVPMRNIRKTIEAIKND